MEWTQQIVQRAKFRTQRSMDVCMDILQHNFAFGRHNLLNIYKSFLKFSQRFQQKLKHISYTEHQMLQTFGEMTPIQ